MTNVLRFPYRPTLLSLVLLGGTLLGSCASQPTSTNEASMDAAAPSSSNYASEMAAPAAGPMADQAGGGSSGEAVPRSLPQLVKRADLILVVESVEDSIAAVGAIAREQQGDILGLQDQNPANIYIRHTAFMQLRVPQAQLDATLQALADMGTVQQQTLSTEDVSNQLVDFEARLRNLRQAEDLLLDIMKRSGDVADVLQVAQELSNIRNSIEQIDAQLNQLRNQVAYSTISLTLEEAIAVVPPQRSMQVQLQETWDGATRSLGKVTVDLLQLGIWLMVYSPYLLLLAGGAVVGYRYMAPRVRPAAPPSEPPTPTA